ncbi:hypothetical protein RhiirA1_461245 [Rhizophagus irregularis]|uniref:Uncharacterized protein n=1 Tax=Rhizophagus irregularis TaxID=588596 RepID=A0A2N0RPP6_9GLOM|nr:hypothetical protein RhiirA1_461245 [Rhizophagus irregularis]
MGKQGKSKINNKSWQEANINWILSSSELKPIGDKLSELRAMNSDEVSIQHDWEIWLKEKKTILACRANHDTGLHIQQDFTSTIANENDFDIEKYSNRKHPLDDKVPDNADNEIPVDSFPSEDNKFRHFPYRFRQLLRRFRQATLEDNDVDKEHEAIYIRAVHLAHKKTTSDIKNILKKIVSLKDRILQYRIINLSIRSVMNPLHKVLSKDIRDPINTAHYKKWESETKPLINTYHNHLENESVFDDTCLDDAIEAVAMKPYNGVFVYKKHYELNWVQDIYRHFLISYWTPEQTEFSYRKNFINPIFAKNGVIIVNVNGSAVYDDLTKLSEDLEKVFKCMQISLFYQQQYHLQREASEKQLQILESYGIIVYSASY